MAITNNPYFEELSEINGPFYATIKIAQEALDVCKALPGRIDVSTAIDYISQGKEILPEDFPDKRLNSAKEYLSYMLDNEVYDAVLASYEASLGGSNLVYKYLTIEDLPRQARVRILSRILWDKRPHKYS